VSEIKEKKYAVMLNGNRITDYMYDEVIHTNNTLYGIKHITKGASIIHAYSKDDGRILFKKEDVADYQWDKNCLFIRLINQKSYIYFDYINKIQGPFSYAGIINGLIIAKKVIKDKKENNYEASGWFNEFGKVLLPIKYECIQVRNYQLVEAKYEGEIILLNHIGICIHPYIYTGFEYYGKLIKFYSRKTGCYGVMRATGELEVPCIFHDIIFDMERELMYLLKDNLYGIYKNGKGIIFAPTFRSFEKNQEVIELTGLDNKTYGYIPKLDLLLPRNCYTYYEKHLKYFNGYKWRKLKYDKK